MDQVSTPNTITYRPLYLHFGRFLISCILTFILTPIANAHQSDDQGLAPSISKALAKAKVKTVVVFDFMGPDDKLSQLGQDLADGFSHTLASSGGKFDVIERSQVRAVIQKNRVAPDVIRDPEIAWWLARQLNAEALVVGKLSPTDGNTLQIAVAAAKTKDGMNIAGLSVAVPITDAMKSRLSKSLSEDHTEDQLPPGSPMDFYPQCIYCPHAKFSDAAKNHRKQGVVALVVLIGEDGVARDIEFARSQQYGLTQKAIEAVQNWKFKPGHGKD